MFPEFYSDLDEDEKNNIPEGKLYHSCNIMWAHERTSKCINEFENLLIGEHEGAVIESTLPPQKAFGDKNPENIQRFAAEKFTHLLEDDVLPTETGSVLVFKDPAGFDLPGVVSQISKDFVLVDFNHPLSGKDIIFKAHIVKIDDPGVSQIEVKL